MAIYFISDTHLGLDFGTKTPIEREKIVVNFLDSIVDDCRELFLVGDIFDFWYEWKRVVPKGYVRLLGRLALMADSGVKIHFLIGNHDQWISEYFDTQLGIKTYREPIVLNDSGKRLFIAHGDKFYRHKPLGRILATLFTNNIVRRLASRFIHPNSMMRFGHAWSQSSRQKHGSVAHVFAQDDDFLVKFANNYLETIDSSINYFIFGHEHTPVIYPLKNPDESRGSCLAILGEWVENPVYGRFEDGELTLHRFNN